jgi:long-chain fatty acid transport protein
VDYNGQFSVDNVTPTATYLGATSKSGFGTRITFPTIVAVGYGIQVTDKFRVESDVEWIQFSKFKSLNFDVEGNAFLFPSTEIAEDWRDTFTAGIAGEWNFAPGWKLRGGYQFYQSPVPDHTFSPTIPDADQNVFTVGFSYNTGPHTFDLGYGLDFYATREITNSQNAAFNGTYKNTVHLFALSYRYNFR